LYPEEQIFEEMMTSHAVAAEEVEKAGAMSRKGIF
jgi:hypothetical protein